MKAFKPNATRLLLVVVASLLLAAAVNCCASSKYSSITAILSHGGRRFDTARRCVVA